MSMPGGFSNSNDTVDYALLTAEDITTPCESITVDTGITWLSGNTMRIDFNACTLTGYRTAKYIQITGAVNPVNNGRFKIAVVNNLSIDFINPFVSDGTMDETTGTYVIFIETGADRRIMIPGTPLYNAKREEAAYQYGTPGARSTETFTFFYKINSDQHTLLQIVNNSATAGLTYTVKWSLDGINYADFATAVSGTVDANETDNLVIAFSPQAMKLNITVSCPQNVTFYIIAK